MVASRLSNISSRPRKISNVSKSIKVTSFRKKSYFAFDSDASHIDEHRVFGIWTAFYLLPVEMFKSQVFEFEPLHIDYNAGQ